MIRKVMTLTALAAISGQALATDVLNHKSPYCGCCTEWTEHMQDAGFDVTEKLHDDMNPIKQKLGVTPELSSCHTAEIDGYVFEGHIPAEDVKAFLENPPRNAIGLAVMVCLWALRAWSMAIRKTSILCMRLTRKVRCLNTVITMVIRA